MPSARNGIVSFPGGDGDHIAEPNRNRCLPTDVVPPGDNGAVSPQRGLWYPPAANVITSLSSAGTVACP